MPLDSVFTIVLIVLVAILVLALAGILVAFLAIAQLSARLENMQEEEDTEDYSAFLESLKSRYP